MYRIRYLQCQVLPILSDNRDELHDFPREFGSIYPELSAAAHLAPIKTSSAALFETCVVTIMIGMVSFWATSLHLLLRKMLEVWFPPKSQQWHKTHCLFVQTLGLCSLLIGHLTEPQKLWSNVQQAR